MPRSSLINFSRPTIFHLELLLDTPCTLPELQNRPLFSNADMFFPLKAWLYLQKSRASFFSKRCCSPGESILLELFPSRYSQAYAGLKFSQVHDGVATARAI